MTRARILLADDHTLVLAGICVILQPHYEIVGALSNGRDLVEHALQIRPDVIIMDISMPVLSGIEAATQIRHKLPAAKLLFLTMHANPVYLAAALRVGATGYVLKSAANEDLLLAIERVLAGRIYVSPGVSGEDLNSFHDPARAAESLRLSPREREVLQLIAKGNPAKQIAFVLNISVKTVTFHRLNIRNKLGLHTTAELTRYALEQNLI